MTAQARGLSDTPVDRVYSNAGNPSLVELVARDAQMILDVGCGAGDNAVLLQQRNPQARIFGISGSHDEAAFARQRMEACWVHDLDKGLPPDALQQRYDVVIFSHVLEHLRHPGDLVRQAAANIREGGSCVIAVPNVLAWAQRVKFLFGRFEYESAGVMDVTHLRFFTYETAADYLLASATELSLVRQTVTGSVPLWLLRRHVLPRRVSAAIDAAGCRFLPNLFGSQILLTAVRRT
jgi:2-polyprenyl-3-methyl-5-hydroxy-6-metoxy-1,4-benzoquinol methylase